MTDIQSPEVGEGFDIEAEKKHFNETQPTQCSNDQTTKAETDFYVTHPPNVQMIKRTKAETDFTHPSSIICPGSTGGRIYLVDSLSTGEGSCWLKKR